MLYQICLYKYFSQSVAYLLILYPASFAEVLNKILAYQFLSFIDDAFSAIF